MLTREEKTHIVEKLTRKLHDQKILLASDFHGVSVEKMRELRRALKKEGAEYAVAKKTLFDRALTQAGMPLKTKNLKGELGMTFGYEDVAAPAKALFTFAKANETFKILGGVLDKKILSAEQVLSLAKLPSRDALRAQVAFALISPIRGLAAVLQGNIKKLIIALHQIQTKKSVPA